MATQFFKAAYEDLTNGDLDPAPDIRALLALSGFAFDADDEVLTDGVIDEYDGTNYARLDLANVASAYNASTDLWEWSADSGDEFGTSPVGPASEAVAWLVFYRHVGADSANRILAATDQVAGINGAGGALALILPSGGVFLRLQPAA